LYLRQTNFFLKLKNNNDKKNLIKKKLINIYIKKS